jgi:hypothetical protein
MFVTRSIPRYPLAAAMVLGSFLAFVVTASSRAEVVAGPAVTATNGGMGSGGPTSIQVKGDVQIQHSDGFKGAKKVAISVFNVAFPDQNVQSAQKSSSYKFGSFSAIGTALETKVTTTKSAYQHTEIVGIDQATRQRVADKAYADFVTKLTQAGYEVVSVEDLAKMAPEYASWDTQPNFTQGRFGTYVAPTGRKVYFMTGDQAKRDPSGQWAQQFNMLSLQSRTQAYNRSPYLANTADIGVIAVTLVIDYGTYKNSGSGKRSKIEISFDPGVVAQAGSIADSATLSAYWGPKSGGFPAIAYLLTPLMSDTAFGAIDDGGNGAGEVIVKADARKFETAADEVAKAANQKLIGAMAERR